LLYRLKDSKFSLIRRALRQGRKKPPASFYSSLLMGEMSQGSPAGACAVSAKTRHPGRIIAHTD
jgi:hypothetical protein